MFQLGSHHMQAFAAAALGRGEERVVGRLRAAFPELFEGLSASTVSGLFAIAIDHAGRYGMESEREVYAYFAAMLYWGPGFEGNETFGVGRLILENEELDGGERGRQIRLRILYETGRLL